MSIGDARRHDIFELMKPADIIDLIISLAVLLFAGATLLYAWKAYAFQRYSGSTSGLSFLHVERTEMRNDESHGSHRGIEAKSAWSYYVSAILSRGPGLRYGARGVVWGEGEFRVITHQIPVWGPNDAGIEFELKPGCNGEWNDVYCGVLWESPRLFSKGFTTHGYRVQVARPGSGNTELIAQQWRHRKGKWRTLKSRITTQADPAESANKMGASFSKQLGESYPDFDIIAQIKSDMGGGKE